MSTTAAATAIGRLLLAASVVAFALAVLLGTLAPAILGFVLVAAHESARRRLAARKVEVVRKAPRTATAGDAVTLRLDARAVDTLPLALSDAQPSNTEVLHAESRSGRGTATLIRRVRLHAPGTITWGPATLHHRDPWNLTEETRSLEPEGTTTVTPEPRWSEAGRRTGRRHGVHATVRARHSLEPVPEVVTVREYQPGDRVRDIDWKRSARHPRLFTKERERVATRPVLILLDATKSMRWARRHAKLTTASRLALGIAASAEAAGVHAALLAFHEDGNTQAALDGRKRVDEVIAALGRLPAPEAKDEIPLHYELPARAMTDEEQTRLARALPVLTGPDPGLAALELALHHATRERIDPSFVVAILDAETAPRRAETAVKRLVRRGHRVVLVIPATGPHHHTRAEHEGRVRERLREAYLRRERLAQALRPQQVPVFVLRPDNVEDVLTEVARSAR